MKVFALVLNAAREPHFRSTDDLKTEAFLDLAASKKTAMQALNKEAAEGSVTYYAEELVKAVNEGEHPDVNRAVMSLAMCTWLVDEIHGNMSADLLRRSDLHFVVRHDGAVARTYLPAGRPEPEVNDMMFRAVWPD
ncbi:hypothetical protein WM26_18585 [Burkholderia cepacia]|uniref:hypothetical protein n=1 Tax=Burkholderia cepacia TaxID=292 RepID=UPI00076CE1CE|nr:hypothetical protein [Burkholderia cepacia]KWO10360.1 hypothetical protein WM26_18585 [Burkholderia cepacia]